MVGTCMQQCSQYTACRGARKSHSEQHPPPPPFHPGSALTVAQRTLLAAQGVQQCALSWLLAMPSLQRCQAHLC
jgi:hypothetical protein